MSEHKGITKFQLVQMFGELELYFPPTQEEIEEEWCAYGHYAQNFMFNGKDIWLDFDKSEYPTLTVHIIKEVCAGFILNKIGKAIEVQL